MKHIFLLLCFACLLSSCQSFDQTLFTISEKNCQANSAKFCVMLGLQYSIGKGVAENHLKAKEYFEKACNLNYGAGCYQLGSLYDNGLYIPQDYLKARQYYEKACNLDNGEGCYFLGYLYQRGRGVKQDYSKAKEYYKKACNKIWKGQEYMILACYDDFKLKDTKNK